MENITKELQKSLEEKIFHKMDDYFKSNAEDQIWLSFSFMVVYIFSRIAIRIKWEIS